MKKRRRSRSNNDAHLVGLGGEPLRKDHCGWCDQMIEEGETWDGDIDVAVFLLAPLRSNARVLCNACAHKLPALVERAVEAHNQLNPELRLRKCPFDGFPFEGVIPNLLTCIDFFYECRAVSNHEDAPKRVADLLLQLEQEHPVEWECSGWKNEFIAELVLGRTECGTVRERQSHAEYWFKSHWKRLRASDRQIRADSPKRQRAVLAAKEIESLKWKSKLRGNSSSTDPNIMETAFLNWAEKHARRGGGLKGTPEFWAALTGAFNSSLTEPRPREDNKRFHHCKIFVSWLNRNWKKHERLLPYAQPWLLHQKLAESYEAQTLSHEDKLSLCEAYQQESDSIKQGPPQPAKVFVRMISNLHDVSPSLLDHERAKINKLLKQKDNSSVPGKTMSKIARSRKSIVHF